MQDKNISLQVYMPSVFRGVENETRVFDGLNAAWEFAERMAWERGWAELWFVILHYTGNQPKRILLSKFC